MVMSIVELKKYFSRTANHTLRNNLINRVHLVK